MKLDYRETVEACSEGVWFGRVFCTYGRGKANTYFWYNGSTSFNGGGRVEKTKVKAKGE
jgi:hypothetical protein